MQSFLLLDFVRHQKSVITRKITIYMILTGTHLCRVQCSLTNKWEGVRGGWHRLGHEEEEDCERQKDGDTQGHLLAGLGRQDKAEHGHETGEDTRKQHRHHIKLRLPLYGEEKRHIRVWLCTAFIIQHVPDNRHAGQGPFIVYYVVGDIGWGRKEMQTTENNSADIGILEA